jgi:hypothetical protein
MTTDPPRVEDLGEMTLDAVLRLARRNRARILVYAPVFDAYVAITRREFALYARGSEARAAVSASGDRLLLDRPEWA